MFSEFRSELHFPTTCPESLACHGRLYLTAPQVAIVLVNTNIFLFVDCFEVPMGLVAKVIDQLYVLALTSTPSLSASQFGTTGVASSGTLAAEKSTTDP